MADNVIVATFILQVAGKPVDNVNKALELVLKKLKDDKRWYIVESEIIEPEYDEESTLYSGMIEAKAEFDRAGHIMEFIMDYTPNSIEVEDPKSINLNLSEFNGILNDMSNYLLASQMQIRKLNATIHMLNSKSKKE